MERTGVAWTRRVPVYNCGPAKGLLDWLKSRTGYRVALDYLLREPLPTGVNWWFVFGSILLFLLGVQLVTGLAETLYLGSCRG